MKRPKKAKKVKIAAATGIAAGVGDNDLAAQIEKAMSDAVAECYKEGITDDATILERKMEARRKVKTG